MKRILTLFVASLAMMATVSCEKNDIIPESQPEITPVTISASINVDDTRTHLGSGDIVSGYPTCWSNDDNIAVIQGNNVFKFTLKSGAGQVYAIFECTDSNISKWDPNAETKAFYPYEWVSVVGNEIKYNVPQIQDYTPGNFANGSAPMVGICQYDINSFDFYNLFGALKLQLTVKRDDGEDDPGEYIISIEVFSDNNSLSGPVESVNYDQSGPTINLSQDAHSFENNKVIVKNSDTSRILNYYTRELVIPIPAGQHQYLSVYIVTNKGTYYKKVNSPLTIKKGKITKMPLLDLNNRGVVNGPNAYVENGLYYEGVTLPGGEGYKYDGDQLEKINITWAPVNCGISYDKTGLRGLLYQWGRKYGQRSDINNNFILDGSLTNASDGSSVANMNYFYKGYTHNSSDSNPYNDYGTWLSTGETDMWQEEVKTAYDPCPEGWRVPTSKEFIHADLDLRGIPDYNLDISNPFGITSVRLYGIGDTKNDVYIDLPLYGYREGDSGNFIEDSSNFEELICYWTQSTTSDGYPPLCMVIQILDISENCGYPRIYSRNNFSNGYSVRCVRDKKYFK